MGIKWTEDVVAELKSLVATDLTASQIGRMLGTSRNSIIGKCKRLGISLFHAQGVRADANPKPPGAPKVKRRAVFSFHSKQPKQRLSPRFLEAAPMPVEPLNIPFLQLNDTTHCKSVQGTGDDGLAVYCGHTRRAGSSYCPWHSAQFELELREPPKSFSRPRSLVA